MKKLIVGLVGSAALALSVSAQTPAPKMNPKDQQQYIWVAPGSFEMGCSVGDNRCAGDEKPLHPVTITKGFWMGQTPVTVAAWKRSGKPPLPGSDEFLRKLNAATGDDNQPVVSVTWDDAKAFCSWAAMRLPTEAEWEYAARAGTKNNVYGWLDDVAWYANNSGRKPLDSVSMFSSDPSGYQKKLFRNGNGPQTVKLKTPNAWGLYDLLGNVWEWTTDYYSKDYYSNSPAEDPAGPKDGAQRVLRGGAWNTSQNNMRVSYRLTNPAGDRVNSFGFRCVGDLP